MRKLFVISVCIVLVGACSTKNESENPQLIFDKLIGTWKLADENQFEQWKKSPDGSYTSRMFSVEGTDTNITEDVKIVNEGGKWNFITLVKGQNKGKSVTFTGTVLQDTLVQFENPAHDFPRMINYNLLSENNLSAFIGGTTDTIYFNFSRVITK